MKRGPAKCGSVPHRDARERISTWRKPKMAKALEVKAMIGSVVTPNTAGTYRGRVGKGWEGQGRSDCQVPLPLTRSPTAHSCSKRAHRIHCKHDIGQLHANECKEQRRRHGFAIGVFREEVVAVVAVREGNGPNRGTRRTVR